MPTKKPSARAMRFWQRMQSWYPASFAFRQPKDQMPGDWCDLIDNADNSEVRRLLDEIKNKHPHPPNFPEVVEIMTRLKPRAILRGGKSAVDQLNDYCLRQEFTVMRLRTRRFIGDAYGVTGVVIPADDDEPELRIMLSDIQEKPPVSNECRIYSEEDASRDSELADRYA